MVEALKAGGAVAATGGGTADNAAMEKALKEQEELKA